MEKIAIRLNRINERSKDFPPFKDRTKAMDIEFIMSCFDISNKRAAKLIERMQHNRSFSSTYEIVLNVNYIQLARYTAKRQVEGLNNYWKYPHVLKFEEEEPENKSSSPLELRPKYRDVYL